MRGPEEEGAATVKHAIRGSQEKSTSAMGGASTRGWEGGRPAVAAGPQPDGRLLRVFTRRGVGSGRRPHFFMEM